MLYVVLDTETTGLDKIYGDVFAPKSLHESGSEVVQIGGMYLDSNMIPTKLFCYYCDCVAPNLNPKASKVNGIDMKTVREHVHNVYLDQIAITNLPEIFKDDVTFIGFNSSFDLGMIRQTMRTLPLDFKWKRLTKPILPKTGRWDIDVMDLLKTGERWSKLSSFIPGLKEQIEGFSRTYGRGLPILTNAPVLLGNNALKAHNSLYDSIVTYLLWRDKVWQRLVI